jgi:hypothetical protein
MEGYAAPELARKRWFGGFSHLENQSGNKALGPAEQGIDHPIGACMKMEPHARRHQKYAVTSRYDWKYFVTQ